ncbi:MAG: hypothetical protein ACI932_000839 [Paracoccaceae bacterium]|jgi:hypothetical protein
MVTSSKILTVTYGTFSCTLEGFDDPFTTLQMVAEYFRKLAAEDRYFGGTPQTPDADMLKRIAEENNPNGIDAVSADDGIILRQMETPLDIKEDDPLVFESVQSEAKAAPEDVAEEIGNEFDITDVTPDPDDISAAMLLALPIAAPDGTTDATPAVLAGETTPKPPLTFFRSRRHEVETSELPAKPEAEASDETSYDADERAIEAAISAAGIAATAATLRNTADDQDQERGTIGQKSVEETLAAIRQNVEQAENSIVEDTVVEEEIVSLQDDELDADDILETLRPSPAPLILDVETEVQENETPIEEVSFETAAIEAEAEVSDEFQSIERLANGVETPVSTPENLAPAEPRVSSLTEEQEAELEAELAAALKFDEDAPADEHSGDEAFEPEPTAEDDADIEDDIEDDQQEDAATAERRRRADQLLGTDDLAGEDKALDRLLAATQSKMNRPEQVRRMNALDQLKAAVAATEAERHVRRKSVAATHSEADEGDAADLAAYRDDLRRAQDTARDDVPARAPNARPAAATLTPAVAQHSPLILVSEQRIDEVLPNDVEEYETEPQQEVTATAGNLALKPQYLPMIEGPDESGEIQGIPADAFSDATSFSDFAERIGAFELTDLLEAAAAYTSIVENKQRFSRAQVMSKLAKLNIGDAYSKEAGLRSFGKLLREGKILRVQDGQFGISKSSRFSIASRYTEE